MTDSLTIRLARLDEREVLERLQWRASLANAGDRDSLLANPDVIRLPPEPIEAQQVFVAEKGGSLFGFAVLLPSEDGECELDGLFVDPLAWRGGVGKALVLHCVMDARCRGARTISVIGNPHAERFYYACGFKRVGSTETLFGPALVMKLIV